MSFYGRYLYGIKTITAGETLDGAHDLILCNNSSDITVSLPAASGMTGRCFQIKKIGNNSNTVTVDPNSTETIDGSSTIVLFIRYDFIEIYSDGTNWQVIGDGRFKHAARMTKTGSQSVSAGGYAKITLDVSGLDATGTMVDTTNNYIVVKRTGTYFCVAAVRFQSFADGKFAQAAIDVSGGQVSYASYDASFTNSIVFPKDSTVLSLTAGNQVSLYAYNGDSSSRSTDAGAGSASPQLFIMEI